MTILLHCDTCFETYVETVGQYNHRRKLGMDRCYCSRRCSGLSRSGRGAPAELLKRKAEYDRERRTLLADRLKVEKAAYYRAHRNPERERRERRKKRHYHAAYIRRYYAKPENKAAKVAYDLERRAAEYGPFGEAWKVLIQLQREIIKRAPDKYERMKARGYYDRQRIQERRRYS